MVSELLKFLLSGPYDTRVALPPPAVSSSLMCDELTTHHTRMELVGERRRHEMDEQVKHIFARLRETCDFAETDFSDVNACSSDGDNGLHCVVMWGDLSAAKALIDAGIDVNKAGDLGYTPLHLACMKGNVELVTLLI